MVANGFGVMVLAVLARAALLLDEGRRAGPDLTPRALEATGDAVESASSAVADLARIARAGDARPLTARCEAVAAVAEGMAEATTATTARGQRWRGRRG